MHNLLVDCIKIIEMIRKAFKMFVNPNSYEEYKKRHNPIWPELEALLKDYGVGGYSIFLEKDTHILFAYAEIESEEKWKAIAETEVCKRWWKYMKDVMETNSDSSPKSIDLVEVFHME